MTPTAVATKADVKRQHLTLTRTGLVQLVNRYLLARGSVRPLLRLRAWQQAAFIARQRQLLPAELIRALTKHGTVHYTYEVAQ